MDSTQNTPGIWNPVRGATQRKNTYKRGHKLTPENSTRHRGNEEWASRLRHPAYRAMMKRYEQELQARNEFSQ